MTALALMLLMVALPMGAAANEIAAGVALAVGLAMGRRSHLPLLGPVVLVAISLLASSLGHDGATALEALGRTWTLALAIAVPWLAWERTRRMEAVELAGLWAAAGVGMYALLQVYLGWQQGVVPWEQGVSGPFSHHLTLGYALVPALSVALHRRQFLPALLIGAGILCSGGSGPALALVVVLAAWVLGATNALVLGLCVSLGAFVLLAMDGSLHERNLLWTAGATLAVDNPLGVGPGNYRAAVGPVQYALEEGYYFANHAHDSALQIAARSGFVAWLGWAWLLIELWRRGGRAAQGAVAALVVGSLTQDVFGDLEVIRALCAWSLLPAPSEPEPEAVVEGPPSVYAHSEPGPPAASPQGAPP